jgi:hypothetical protein
MRYMDYDKFKKEYEAFEEWNSDKGWEYLDAETPKNNKHWDLPNLSMYDQADLKNGKRWLKIVEGYDRDKDTPVNEAVDRVRFIREDIDRFQHERVQPEKDEWGASIQNLIDRVKSERVGPVDNDGNFYHPEAQNDMVNSPAHYTRGSQEVIDIIEEAIQDAPDVKAGMLQAQALKYLLRLWLKSNAPQDAKKCSWYLTRLINHLGETK